MKLVIWSQRNPRLALSLGFLLWKSLILSIAATSPGLGYDTSTDLLKRSNTSLESFSDTPTIVNNKLFNLVRWDAVYYTQMAQRGLLLEQEWAFGIGFPSVISYLKDFILRTPNTTKLEDYIIIGIVLSHVSHWAVSLLVWSIARLTLKRDEPSRDSISFVAAALHIVSPAGIFLSAPCPESFFACLHMLGFFLLFKATSSTEPVRYSSLLMRALAGVSFGLATSIRSNGILSGTVFLVDALQLARRIVSPQESSFVKPQLLLALQFTIIGGICIGLGMLVPQYIAYQEYCTGGSDLRPWCTARIPSIYTWVQSHYWYWTWGNVPLFLLAAPSLYLLIRSGIEGCTLAWSESHQLSASPLFAARAALPQLLLAVLALFSYHVQIINRLSSAYPFWYIWLATLLHKGSSDIFGRFCVIYALIQAGLYASFLPPA